MPRRKETDLYQPVKALLEAQGYTVRGEVNGCDVVAARDDELVIVELKTSFTLPLLLQGVERQRLSDAVYLAFEAPRAIKAATGVGNAASILHSNHYGWFERIERGIYGLTLDGQQATAMYSDVLQTIAETSAVREASGKTE